MYQGLGPCPGPCLAADAMINKLLLVSHLPSALVTKSGISGLQLPSFLLIHGMSTDFDRTAIDFNITEVEPNAALAAGSAELPLVAALMAEQSRIKDHETQLADHGVPPMSLIDFHSS